MFTIFKSKPRQSTDSIIEEIHQTFYSEGDVLLKAAQNTIKVETDWSIEEKGRKLISLGFSSAPEAEYYKRKCQERLEADTQNRERKVMQDTILYFAQKYPTYKFITEESVIRICRKYNLVYGEVSKYKGTVPSKNLADIDRFKINMNDECYRSTFFSDRDLYCSFSEIMHRSHKYYEVCPLEIAAPIKDFNMSKSEIKNFKVVNKRVSIPDPIVLKPVVSPYDASNRPTKHYLIVTAWGLEAKDDDVLNAIHN